jgi:hypothetical protein
MSSLVESERSPLATRTDRGRAKPTAALAVALVLMTAGVLALLRLAEPAAQSAAARTVAPAPLDGASQRHALAAYGKLPLAFVPNRGQTDARVRYSAQQAGLSVFVTRPEAVLGLAKGKHGAALALRFLGASPAAIEGRRPGTDRVNYLLGNDPTKWHSDLPTYGQVVYRNLWPGVDLVFRGAQGRLRYDFVLRPGAKVADIRLAYRGTGALSLDRAGNLRIPTPLGVLRDERPVSYQQIGGRRVPVASRFSLAGRHSFGLALGAYNPRYPLVIDPGLVYSTFLGGTGTDQGFAIAVDSGGAAYVTGRTGSTNFPTTVGAVDTGHNGGDDVFVSKLNAAGSALVYSTFLGGSGSDMGHGIAVDAGGAAYVTGTAASGFPTTTGAFQTTYGGGTSDAFVSKLNAAGSMLVYSTFLGGSSTDDGWGIAVDATGAAYVTGLTASSTFPTTVGAFDVGHNGLNDAFVSKLNPSLTGIASLVYSTFLGGNSNEQGYGIAVDATGAYVTGLTSSSSPTTGFPTTSGAYDTSHNGSNDAFVSKLNTTGSMLLYSTFLGGTGDDQGRGIAVDAGGTYVTGVAAPGSPNFPTTSGAYDTSHNGLNDAFVSKLNPSLTGVASLVYSTFLGDSGNETGLGIAVDSGGASVTGQTSSTGFPTTTGAFDTTHNSSGVDDAFVSKLNAAGSALVYSTFLGGSGVDRGMGIAVDSSGMYVTGLTISLNFPTMGAFDTSNNGQDGFVSKLSVGPGPPATLTLSPKTATNVVGNPHTVTATVKDSSGNPTPGIVVRFSVSGANSTSGMNTTNASGQATFTYTGTVAGGDTISAFADTDNDTTQDTGEPGDTAAKTWTPGPPFSLTLAPPTATNVVGTTHCVTATVKDSFGNPTPGITVVFSVPTSVATFASPSSGSATTNSSGQAMFCFSASLPGMDAIHAFADFNPKNGSQDTGEPFGDATKTWTPPPSTAFCEVKITNGGWFIANNGDRASFGGNAKVAADGSIQGQEQYQDQGPAQPRNVHSIELTATTCSDDKKMASIFGRATINGSGSFVFRIDVTDQGEPGTNDTYGIMMSDGYASGQHTLMGGNVQIHNS